VDETGQILSQPARPGAGEELTVRGIMASPVATATPDTPVGAAHQLLRQHGIRHLCVLDGALLVGIVSQRDLLRAQSDALPVRDVMVRTLYVLSPDTPLTRAARILRERRLPVLPVLDGRRLVGMVRAVDVLETAWDHARA
jgi:CBS domain-containing protein